MYTVLWRRVDAPGHDACAVMRMRDGWRISGVAVFLSGKQPARLSYDVHCDHDWITQNAFVEGFIGSTPYLAKIVRSARGRWKLNGVLQPQLDGCDDLDIAFTPATNTIALRRMLRAGIQAVARSNIRSMSTSKPAGAMNTLLDVSNMERVPFSAGETAYVRAAWLNAEDNEFSVLEQTYRKISRDEYRYHAPRFDFRAKLTVNSHKIVTNYPGLWKAES